VGRLTLDKLFGNRIVRASSKIIALNEMEANEYMNFGISEGKIKIIPNGIDLSEYANLPLKGAFKEKFDIENEKKIVLYLGRIHKTKGIELLIKSYAHLIREKECSDSVLVVAGPDDGYLIEAKNLVASLGISESVLFTEYLSNENKMKALVDAQVFVTPSFYGFPMTFLEACITGTPIITTRLGDVLEWIDGSVGYVTHPTEYDLAKAINAIISDEELRERFSKNCIEIVQSRFDIEKVTDGLCQVYAGITSKV
jgi:glycosyltransferase involved in cell wall biosynthesis